MKPNQFSNPRKSATIDGWPSGRMRVQAKFEVEKHPTRGERVSRVTQTKNLMGWNAPHRTTYAEKFFIVDGDDGRTYMLGKLSGAVVVWSSDMKHIVEYVNLGDDRYAGFMALVDQQ